MLTGQEPGLRNYKENHYITSIIEKATNKDPSLRYINVTTMQKELEHALHTRPLDKIPLLRELPGFRTHTLWKEIVALCFYISLIVIMAYDIKNFSGIWAPILLDFIAGRA